MKILQGTFSGWIRFSLYWVAVHIAVQTHTKTTKIKIKFWNLKLIPIKLCFFCCSWAHFCWKKCHVFFFKIGKIFKIIIRVGTSLYGFSCESLIFWQKRVNRFFALSKERIALFTLFKRATRATRAICSRLLFKKSDSLSFF